MGDELKSRAVAIGNKPWYVGEMGWCRASRRKSFAPTQHCRRSGSKIYRHWAEQALFGCVFSMGTSMAYSTDEFWPEQYQVMAIFPK